MKRFTFVCLSFFLLFSSLFAEAVEPNAAASALFVRMLGADAGRFEAVVEPKEGNDSFRISLLEDGRIQVIGNNPVSTSSGLYYYLKNYADSHLSWCGDRIELPEVLMLPDGPVEVTTPHKYRPYFNYCTFSYSAAWWDWERWEREIDFMAMNGINMPLSIVGLEAVWYYSLLEIGYSDEEAREFLSGPAFFAWQWMTNIQSHCGPLPRSWIDSHLELGQKILKRQRELGMTPMQQGFSGFVPVSLTEKFPKARIAREGKWLDFPGTAQLDPLDPLFLEFGSIFLNKQIELFGTDHHYAVDPFHEGHPPRPGRRYLRKVGSQIWSLLSSVDPDAVWMMQSWSLRPAIQKQAPKERLIVLDLAGYGRSFSGYPFVSGILHNFGNRINLHGDLQRLAENPYARISRNNRNSAGFGLFMEGITQNPVYYDLAFENIWRSEGQELDDWFRGYTARRYGSKSKGPVEAWRLMTEGPYRRGTDGVEKSSIFATRPGIELLKSGPNDGLDIPYDPATVEKAWGLLLAERETLSSSEGYRFDIMDFGRQALSNYGQRLFDEVKSGWKSGNGQEFERTSALFLELLLDVDRLLMTREENSFGKWYSDALSWAGNEKERELYSLNASMLLTHWGPEEGQGEPRIFDYAWKEWSTLVGEYYYDRWEFFFAQLTELMAAGKPFSELQLPGAYGRPRLRSNQIYSDMTDLELKWIYSLKEVPVTSGEDTAEVALELYRKYRPYFSQESPAL